MPLPGLDAGTSPSSGITLLMPAPMIVLLALLARRHAIEDDRDEGLSVEFSGDRDILARLDDGTGRALGLTVRIASPGTPIR
ncbi:hypothetical protein Lxx03490 [Leifsonia xyli subsp. xyli str. CTCB07]|uniref:Uncharacterized protein n=1 Tax=Leifsonia xyli subsp. xyli (strain CTCB07) TaxID=281090 RepID=Q6AGY0_LEIXX|nr:hypothetical protein Lxx03490 [Leifsonia xyli subsp. xyli str. CTCB07]